MGAVCQWFVYVFAVMRGDIDKLGIEFYQPVDDFKYLVDTVALERGQNLKRKKRRFAPVDNIDDSNHYIEVVFYNS